MRYILYPQLVEPIAPPPPVVLPDRWLGSYPDYLFSTKNYNTLYDSVFFVNTITTTPQLFPDKWLGNRPDIIYQTKNTNYLYPSLFETLLTNLPNPVLNYAINQDGVEIIYPRTLLYQSLAFVQFVAQVQLPDKWLGQYPDQTYKAKNTNYLYESLFFTNTFPFTPFIESPFDSRSVDIIYRTKNTNYLYESLFFVNIFPFLPGKNSGWQFIPPDQTYRSKNTNYLYESSFFLNTFPPLPLVSMWMYPIEQPISNWYLLQKYYLLTVIGGQSVFVKFPFISSDRARGEVVIDISKGESYLDITKGESDAS